MQHQDNNPADGPVRSMLDLPTDVPEQLLAFYDEHRILERARAFSGCLAAEWWQPTDGGDPVISALWSGADRYQAWVDEPWRGQVAGGLAALLRAGAVLAPARIYSVRPAEAGTASTATHPSHPS